MTESRSPIRMIYTLTSLQQFITVSDDNSVVLWELESEGNLRLTPTKEFKLDPEG